MSSGGSKNTTTTTDNAPPAWAVPYFQQGLQMAQNVATQPYTPYTGQQVAGMTADQLAGMGAIRQQAGDTALLDAGTGYVQGLLGGSGQYRQQANPYEGRTVGVGSNRYLGATTPVGSNNMIGQQTAVGSNSYLGQTTDVGTNRFAGDNPYLDQMIGAASRDVTDAYTKSTLPTMLSQFSSGGAFGGTAMADALASSQQQLAGELGELSNQFRFQDYQTQQQLAESDIARRMAAQQADLARNSGLAEAGIDRRISTSLADAQRNAGLLESGLDRRLQATQTDLARNAGLAESDIDRRISTAQADLSRNAGLADARLGRDQQAWDSWQGRQLQALGMIPGLDQASYYGGQQLMGIGQQQQINNQAVLDALYGDYVEGRDWDQNRLQSLLGALGTVQGGSSSQTGANPNYRSAGQNALTAAAIAAAFFA